MVTSIPERYVTVGLLILTLVGFSGWIAPVAEMPITAGDGYTVEHRQIDVGDQVTTADLYLPTGDEQVPGVVFGAGSGTAPQLYSNYGATLAKNGFAVLIPGQTSGLEPGKPIYWEIRRETPVVLEQATARYHAWVTFLASHPRVDEDRLVIGGHSGGANSAYRVAYDREDIDGVVAIAGRFAPERDRTLRTNLLLATGSNDSLVPPSKLTEISETLTGVALQPGERTGSFENGSAVRVVVAPGATHLTEADNPLLVRVTTRWALRSVGKSPPKDLGMRVRSLESVVQQLLFGLVGVVSGTAILGRTLGSRLAEQQRRDRIVALLWLASFVIVLHTTLSRRIYHLGPTSAQATKYVLLGSLLLGVGASLHLIALRRSIAETRIGSGLLDLGFLLVPAGVFILASTQFVTFQLVTTTVLSSVVLALLGAMLLELELIRLPRLLRWAVVGVTILWILPAIVPPYP